MSRAVNGWHWLWRGWYVAIITGRRPRLMVKRYRGTFSPYAPELTEAERAFLAESAKDLPVWTPRRPDESEAS